MRYIKKAQTEPSMLREKHARPPQSAADASDRWDNRFQSRQKQKLQKILLQEQFYLCCYSELRADSEGLGYHIEHVRPKSKYPELTFDYQNLAASAINSDPDLKTFRMNQWETFGGDAKGDEHDDRLFISCLQADCARFFFFAENGKITPKIDLNPFEQSQARHTIDILNLNSPYLVNRRKRRYQELAELIAPLLEEADVENLKKQAYAVLRPNDGKLEAFFSLSRQLFGQFAELILLHDLPDLI